VFARLPETGEHSSPLRCSPWLTAFSRINRFEYLADPIKIFKGRMIAMLFLILYTVSGQLGGA
jgi:uncharacterized membrane protein YjgN (DUF898 family)